MKNILLVEDVPELIALYREQLSGAGFEVLVAEDGLTAMKMLHHSKPALVVLDLMLPKFNGAEVLKFIRTSPELKNVKVLIFSNAYMTEIADRAAALGADASLMKVNCTGAQLIKAVNDLLNGDDMTKQPESQTTPPSS